MHNEIKLRINDGSFSTKLTREVSNIYALFLEKYIRLEINGERINPLPIPIAESDEIQSAYKKLNINEVSVRLYAGLLRQDSLKKWKSDLAGWYVACNGRLIIFSNKDELTGWGEGPLPQFHSKYRGFIGIAFFQSIHPYKLPWTTSKKGIYEESEIYQKVKKDMGSIAKPVIQFLNSMYTGEIIETPQQRELTKEIEQIELFEISRREESTFKVNPKNVIKKSDLTTISYKVKKVDLEKIKRQLRNPTLSNSEIGRFTFNEYLNRIEDR